MRGGLRIALANCAYPEGCRDPDVLLGQYHSLTGWANALADAGAETVVVVQRFARDAVLRRGNVDYRFVADGAPPYPPAWFWGARVSAFVRALDPDVVDVKGLVFPLLVRHLRLKLRRRTALVVRDHGGFSSDSPSYRTRRGRAFYRLGLGAADGFLFTARAQALPWIRSGIIESTSVYELPEASTDLASWPVLPEVDERLPGHPALLWVGRLDSNKDPLTVVDAFAAVLEKLPNAILTLVYGEDNLLADVRTRIEQNPSLRRRVVLRGRLGRSALPAVYAGADVFVLGSHHEVACFSLIEALSFGLTPVVTDIPPFRALTDGGSLGALFPPGDAKRLAEALGRLAGVDFAARRRAVREHFERVLSWSAVGRRALEIYHGIVRRRAGAGNRSPVAEEKSRLPPGSCPRIARASRKEEP